MSDEKIQVRATRNDQLMDVVILDRQVDRIQVVIGEGVHSVRCDLTPNRAGSAYVGSVMGREIVYERSREQVRADIARSDPRMKPYSRR